MTLGLLSIANLAEVGGPALAVMDPAAGASQSGGGAAAGQDLPAMGPTVAPTRPVNPDDGGAIVRLDVPVAWQLTRSRLEGAGAKTLTESFRETWTLEQRPGGAMFLKSPRARVPAYLPSAAEGTSPGPGLPEVVVVAERDFAQLVGIRSEPSADAAAGGAESDASGPVTPISLSLAKPARGGVDVTLNWSDDEHYAVHLDVGVATLF
jgi:hypothetical protein